MHRIVFLGPPASGKGTQANLLSARLGIPTVSTGAELREQIAQGSSLGITAERLLASGELLPDSVMNELIENWIGDNGNRFIFDGYPRTVSQAESLDQLLYDRTLTLDCVIGLDVDDNVLRHRVAHRLTCRSCNEVFRSASTAGIRPEASCPSCESGILYQRADDNLETFELRLEEYARKTQAVSNYYSDRGRLLLIEGNGSPEEVFERILLQLSQAIKS